MTGDREFFNRFQDQFLINNTDMVQIYSAGRGVPGRPEDTRDRLRIDSSQTTDHRSLLGNQKFENILLIRAASLNDILSVGFRDLDVDIDTTIRLIEAELAN